MLSRRPQTDQAKADMARLAQIKAQREAAAATRKAEAEGATGQLPFGGAPW